MNKDPMIQTIVYLIACALHGHKPKEISGIDYEVLYEFSRFHSITAMIAAALGSGGFLAEPYMNPEQIRTWKDAGSKALRKNLLFDVEREQILKDLDEQGVWYAPLKGSILKDMYPASGMRQMADNDILYDKSYQAWLKEYMMGRGYQAIRVGLGNHDVYEKPPIYNFEFHTALFGATADEAWISYYDNIKERLRKDTDNRSGYHFSDEDFYVYLMLHAYKHFRGGGTGVRSLVDVYVFVNAKEQSLNWDYMRGELRTLGIAEFEEKTRALALKLFADASDPDLNQEEKELLSFFMGSGTYGTLDHWLRRKLKAGQADHEPITIRTKLRFCMERLFPGPAFMKQYHPFCAKHPWSMPFWWIYRIIRALILRREAIQTELRVVRNAEDGNKLPL